MTHHSAPVVLGEPIDQPSYAPSAKLKAVGATGLATAVLLYLAQTYAHLALPETVAEAVVLVGGWAGGYLKRDKAVAAVVTRVEHALAPILANPIAGPVLDAVVGQVEAGAVADAGLAVVRGPQVAEESAG